MTKHDVEITMIRAKIESATPDRVQWKPYSATLTFDEPGVYVEIPVPTEFVRKEKDGSLTLTLEGWTILLDGYATAVEQMNERWTKSFTQPGKHRAY